MTRTSQHQPPLLPCEPLRGPSRVSTPRQSAWWNRRRVAASVNGSWIGSGTSQVLVCLLAAGCASPPASHPVAIPELGQTAPPSPGASPGASLERHLGVMGTGLHIVIWAPDRSDCLTASEGAVRALEDTEARLSTWLDSSEFSGLNQAPVGTGQTLSPMTREELKTALGIARATDGLFDPTLGRLVQAWDLRGVGRMPSDRELQQARLDSGFRAIEIKGSQVRRSRGVLLEEGAFGKGAGLDRAREVLIGSTVTGASLNLGGQWLFVGQGEWSLQVAHPLHRSEAVLHLSIPPGSLATSANSERQLELSEGTLGHLLDPRTGMPSKANHSVSVWAKSALLADALSTALFIDPSRAAEFASKFDVEVVLLEPGEHSLRASITPGLIEHSRALIPGLEIVSLDIPTVQ